MTVDPLDWSPIGVDALEPAAWEALCDRGCVALTAGPGAGKTEVLAQKAAFLLQTGGCPEPRKILAISYKRDSAANLERRVRRRVPNEGLRFDSMTFDAFARGIVDRFRLALPRPWRRQENYELIMPKNSDCRQFLDRTARDAPAHLKQGVLDLKPGTFLSTIVGSRAPAALDTRTWQTGADYAVWNWWRVHYHQAEQPRLDFKMIARLAELLVRETAALSRALRATYPVVFVDEFQDTTQAQFDLLLTAFGGHSVVTAVGDRKQRIMGFGGALPDAFNPFIDQFGATERELSWNFRSSVPLVALQQVIAERLTPGGVNPVSRSAGEDDLLAMTIWTFPDAPTQARHIAEVVAEDIIANDRRPTDFALVARQKVADIEKLIGTALATNNLSLRNDDARVGEMSLQDLLKNDITRLLLGLLRLAAEPRGLPEVWSETLDEMIRLRGTDHTEDKARDVSDELSATVARLQTWMGYNDADRTAPITTVMKVAEALGIDNLRRHVQSRRRGEDLDAILHAFSARLSTVIKHGRGWRTTLTEFEASEAVSLLTVHRSKGLEYHTVFFLDLDDEQWWSYDQDTKESLSTFFVGLSRAAQRIVFTNTTSKARQGKLANLYTMLDEAGVEEHSHDAEEWSILGGVSASL